MTKSFLEKIKKEDYSLRLIVSIIKTPTTATAIITAKADAMMTIVLSGADCTGAAVVVVEVGAWATVKAVAAAELPYESSPANEAMIL